MNPKIGIMHDNGTYTWPTETLAGASFAHGDFDPPPAMLHTLDAEGRFAVGDVWPPRGFDVQGALDKLKAELAQGGGSESTPAIGFEAGE